MVTRPSRLHFHFDTSSSMALTFILNYLGRINYSVTYSFSDLTFSFYKYYSLKRLNLGYYLQLTSYELFIFQIKVGGFLWCFLAWMDEISIDSLFLYYM
jgi:hypothetical protein